MDMTNQSGAPAPLSAREQLADGQYSAAQEAFAALLPEPQARFGEIVARHMAEAVDRDSLLAAWQEVAALLDGTPSFAEDAVSAYEMISIFTAHLYRSCNEMQKRRYTQLKKSVDFEHKEYVLTSLQQILLEADTQYHAIYQVIFSFVALVTEREALPPPEPLRQAVFAYAKTAADLSLEVSLPKELSLLPMAHALLSRRWAATAELQSMEKGIAAAALQDPAALADWDFWAPYADMAGVRKKDLEKVEKRRLFRQKVKNLLSFRI